MPQKYAKEGNGHKYTIGLNQEIQLSSKVSVVPFTAQCVDSLGRLSRHGGAVWLD